MYDYLVVGCGLSGAVFAREMADNGRTCLMIEKRDHIGGQIYTTDIEGVTVHRYGPHVFHTDDGEVWAYVNRFCAFNRYINSPVANYRGELYNLPFNMNTFSKMWGVVTPAEAKAKIAEQASRQKGEPRNLEEQAIRCVGRDLYEKLIRGYTEKQWGRPCAMLPKSIIERLPVRFTFDNNYFSHRHQGVPEEGYTALVEKLLSGMDVRTDTDYLARRDALRPLARRVVYTGMADAYFQYRLGPLEYRSLRFEDEILDTPNAQGVAVMNFTDAETPYTRVIEHKHLNFGNQDKTVVTREYPQAWTPEREAYYPVGDEINTRRAAAYAALAREERDVLFLGRLGRYQYLDMDRAVRQALDLSKRELAYE